MYATGRYWWLVNIRSGNVLVPSDNKPLAEAMLTQIYVAFFYFFATDILMDTKL